MLVAIYCRLSKEDTDKASESESIQNQKSILIKYAVEKEWDIYEIYCDDDYSGADRKRPAFNKMLEDAQKRKFNIILVKTQSRFTRDMELVEKYIHGLFMEWGIRFVAAVDNTDTAIKGTKKARQISGLINEWYLEDLSENIRAVFDNKRRCGEYIGNGPVYGYLLENGTKNFVIDFEAAIVVKRIFEMYKMGFGMQRIANTLNEERVPNPTKHKQDIGLKFRNGYQINSYAFWNTVTLSRMLHDQTYIGSLVQGRTRSKSYKTKGTVPNSADMWVIVPNHHEPIIDEETFNTVQDMITKNSKISQNGEIHALAGKVFCADCKSIMHKTNNKKINGIARHYLRCNLYKKNHNLCTSHSIRLDVLESTVLERLKNYIKRFYEPIDENEIVDTDEFQEEKAKKAEQQRLESEIMCKNKAIKDLYLDKSKGIIDETLFCELNKEYLFDKREAEKRLLLLIQSQQQNVSREEKLFLLKEKIEEIEKVEFFTRELASVFINRIEIHAKCDISNTQKINIEWKI